ncbi:sigma-54-dependent Fis family transcriptional regulator [bacterium]|nr:sigma-54-dependent Fis family transcriptional regulator [bacterium]
MNRNAVKILIVDDEHYMRESLQEILSDIGYFCDVCANGKEALDKLKAGGFDLIISDVKMPDMNGIDFLSRLRDTGNDTPFLFMTAFATVPQAVQAIKKGAEDYLTKPFDPELLIEKIEKIVGVTQKTEVPDSKNNKVDFIGESPKIKQIYQLVKTIAPTSSTVLIEGESGTGKELVANAIHKYSKRSAEPFIKVNCAAIPNTLLESELFGHVKGSFTGAVKDKKGKFALAHKGTIYLDEIGDMELTLQAKILRVIQERELTRVGSETDERVDVRIIAATNIDLRKAVAQNDFREDLFYRLNVINIFMPPLRERKEDIPGLVNFFINNFNNSFGKDIDGVDGETMRILVNYNWPGNIRELENAVERAVILTSGDKITKNTLPEQICPNVNAMATISITGMPGMTQVSAKKSSFYMAKNQFDKIIVKKALEEAEGNVSRAAQLLGISRHSLRYQMDKLGLKK